jgi:hypothetical protein
MRAFRSLLFRHCHFSPLPRADTSIRHTTPKNNPSAQSRTVSAKSPRPTEALNLRRQVEYEQKASAVSLLMTGAFGCVSRWPRYTLLVAGFGALVGASWPEQKKRRPKKDSGPP